MQLKTLRSWNVEATFGYEKEVIDGKQIGTMYFFSIKKKLIIKQQFTLQYLDSRKILLHESFAWIQDSRKIILRESKQIHVDQRGFLSLSHFFDICYIFWVIDQIRHEI